jgi:multiple sugar transport system permease protein
MNLARLYRFAGLVAVLVMLFYLFAPVYWMIKSAFTHTNDLRVLPPEWIPGDPTFENIAAALQLPGYNEAMVADNTQIRFFSRALWNTLIVASVATVLATGFGAITAYSISRFLDPRKQRQVMLLLLASRMLPVIAVMVPIYLASVYLGVIDTLIGLSMVYTGLLLPFAIWILEAHFRSFPKELEEAAHIDGCSRFRTFLTVVLPLSWNGIFAAGLFVFISVWADFVVGFIMTNTERSYPISVVIARNISAWREPDWGLLNASGLIAASVPVGLALLFYQMVSRGRLSGAVKG